MSPERYSKVKEIFLQACEKSREERSQFVGTASGGDGEIVREVEGLLAEHDRAVQVVPEEPEGPLGPMSSILSRAGIKTPTREGKAMDETAAWGGDSSQVPEEEKSGTGDDDDAHDQSAGTRTGIVDAGRFMAGTMVAGRDSSMASD